MTTDTEQFKIEQTSDSDMVLSFLTMRRALGILGFVLPVVLLIGAYVTEQCLRTSISAYYYSPSPVLHGVFVGILYAMGFFLIAYKGYQLRPGERISDNTIASIAGVGAICVAIFPTVESTFAAAPPAIECAATALDTSLRDKIYSGIHFGAAGLFFGAVAVMCWVFFTRTADRKPPKTWKKRVENLIYRTCAVVIAACIVLIGVEALLIDYEVPNTWWPFYWVPGPVFWFEAIAVCALSVAWLTKGKSIRGLLNMLGRHTT